MANQTPVTAGDFAVAVDWPAVAAKSRAGESDPAFGRLSLILGDQNVTSWRGDNGATGDGVEISLYHLAEWIALNWWALLYEPRKGDADADEYAVRHWLGTARDGFALPDLWITPAGPRVEVEAIGERYLPCARLTFLNEAACAVERDAMAARLGAFVDDVLGRMRSAGIDDTTAHEAWACVHATAQDQKAYCQLIGALGLSPYDDHRRIDVILDRVSEIYDASVVLDLCQASDAASLRHASDLLAKVAEALPNASAIDLSSLATVGVPSDTAPKPWRRGVDAADRLRNQLGVSARDPHGAAAVFDRLHVETAAAIVLPKAIAENGRISAAIRRDDAPEMRVALIEPGEAQRRFTAARAVFMGWLDGANASRLLTGARTRDQQASRAFAAEVLAPFDYIRLKNGGRRSIYPDRIEEIAGDLGCSPAVVRYQAKNNRLHVVERGIG